MVYVVLKLIKKNNIWTVEVSGRHFDKNYSRSHYLSGFNNLRDVDVKTILAPIIEYTKRGRPATVQSYLRSARELGDGIKNHKIRQLPKSESEWQRFVVKIHRYIITRTDSKASLKVRNKTWQRIRDFIVHLQELDIVPLGVVLPKPRHRLQIIDISSYSSQLIGEKKCEPIDGEINKILVNISLARTDAEYLDEVRDLLNYRRKLVYDALVEYWNCFVNHYKYGERLLLELDKESLLEKFENSIYTHSHEQNKTQVSLCSPYNEEGLANLLYVLKHIYNGRFSRNDFINDQRLPPYGIRKLPKSIPSLDFNRISDITRIRWMIGDVSSQVLSVAISLLIMNNPSYTPMSLVNAKISSRHSKDKLEISDIGFSFSIDKPRAGIEKSSELDKMSYEIISTIIKLTECNRNELSKESPQEANNLWIYYDYFTTKEIKQLRRSYVSAFLSNAKESNNITGLLQLFPHLNKEFEHGSITPSKLRATEGTLEWFRTGNIHAMSKVLGNTYKVSLEHYLPKPLLTAWNTRIIRRYQNLWLVIASANEDFLLDITDFNSIEELHLFITDMLSKHAPNDSPLATELHERFQFGIFDTEAFEKTEGTLSVPINTNILVAVYLYLDSALSAGVEPKVLETPDIETGIKPRQIMDLAILLKSQLQTHNEKVLRTCHEKAISIVEEKRSVIKWPDLIAKKGCTNYA